MEEIERRYPTMESFLDEFPALKHHVMECNSTGEQITRLNIVIANLRHLLGWSAKNQPYGKFVFRDLEKDETVHELAGVKCNSDVVLKLLLKCMTRLLWMVMDSAMRSEPLFEDEKIEVDFENMKQTILSYGVM